MPPVPIVDRSYADLIQSTPGLVAYWRLGDRSGTVARDGGGRYAGTYNGAPVRGVEGAIRNDLGRSASFTAATADYVSSPTMADLPLGSAKRTLEFWTKGTVTGGRFGFFGYGDAGSNQVINVEQIPGSGFYIVGYGPADLASSPVANFFDGKWHHLAATYDGVTLRGYIDGRQVATGARTLNTVQAAKVLGIGRQSYPNGSFYYVEGTIAEAAIYRRELSQLELAEHSAAGRGAL